MDTPRAAEGAGVRQEPALVAQAQTLTVLISSAGRRVALMNAFRHAAVRLGVELRVLACDLRPEWSSACQLADRAFAVPAVSDPCYAATLCDLCEQQGVGLVIPTIDPELAPLSAARDRFLRRGAVIAISDPEIVLMAGDKLATAAALSRCGIPTPRSATLAELRSTPGEWSWPVIVKPRAGSAGVGVRLVARPADLPEAEPDSLMAQQLLQGDEWTINIFVDNCGTLRAIVPHRRLSVRAGEVEKGVTRRVAVFDAIAKQMVGSLRGMRGALCFQSIMAVDGSVSVFEINARFGGGYPLADRAGASFARWLIEERCGLESTADNNWQSGMRMLRFDDAVFL